MSEAWRGHQDDAEVTREQEQREYAVQHPDEYPIPSFMPDTGGTLGKRHRSSPALLKKGWTSSRSRIARWWWYRLVAIEFLHQRVEVIVEWVRQQIELVKQHASKQQ